MDREMMRKKLLDWRPEGYLFRDYERVKTGELPLQDFIRIYEADPENLMYALEPESINKELSEERFFPPDCDIEMRRPPRYYPLFYHKHDFFEFIYVLKGSCRQYLQYDSVLLKEGDLFMMSPDLIHGIQTQKDGLILNVLVRRSTFLDIFMNTIRENSVISLFFQSNMYAKKKIPYILFHTADSRLISDYLVDMYAERERHDPYSSQMMYHLLCMIFTELIRSHTADMEMPPQTQKQHASTGALIDYIVCHYTDLSLQQLGEVFGYTPQYCTRLIREATGLSYQQFLTNIRIHHGEQLLKSTSLTIAQIAEDTGYQNPETFIRAFRRAKGCPPGAYRKTLTLSP